MNKKPFSYLKFKDKRTASVTAKCWHFANRYVKDETAWTHCLRPISGKTDKNRHFLRDVWTFSSYHCGNKAEYL